MNTEYLVVLITVPDQEEAEKLSRTLLEKRLAACVNMVPEVRSLFWWQGKIDGADEVLLLVKSRQSCFEKLKECVKSCHSYDVPEILALPVAAGHEDYLAWLKESL